MAKNKSYRRLDIDIKAITVGRLPVTVSFLLALAACQAANPPADVPSSVIFFEEDSASLDGPADQVIRSVAQQVRARPGAIVHIQGYAPPDAGSPTYNMSLSRTRALAVADSLAKAGVAHHRIRVEPQGAEPYALVPLQSRRVEIILSD